MHLRWRRPTIVLDEYFRVQVTVPNDEATQQIGHDVGATLAATSVAASEFVSTVTRTPRDVIDRSHRTPSSRGTK